MTKSGLEVECDFVVIGAGVHPEHPARRAGGHRDRQRRARRPLPRDERARHLSPPATSPSTTASCTAGGCGSSTGTSPSTRASTRRSTCSASRQAYDVVPYFWSDLADWTSMEYVGPASEWDEIWWRGSREEGKFTAWYVKDGRLAAALTVGRSDDLTVASAAARGEGTDVSRHARAIEDPDRDLASSRADASRRDVERLDRVREVEARRRAALDRVDAAAAARRRRGRGAGCACRAARSSAPVAGRRPRPPRSCRSPPRRRTRRPAARRSRRAMPPRGLRMSGSRSQRRCAGR